MKRERWTTADVEQLRFFASRMELSLSDMAAKLGRTQKAVRLKLVALGLIVVEQQKKRVERKCMCCLSPFQSEHSMNRLCGRCRTISTTPFDIGAALLA